MITAPWKTENRGKLKSNAASTHNYLVFAVGCDKKLAQISYDITPPQPINADLIQTWTRTNYSMSLATQNSPSTAVPCFSTQGSVRWSPGPPPPPPVVPCPISDLLPKPIDACSVALEAGFGTPIPASACPRSVVLDDPNGEPCLRRKLGEIGVAYDGPTSTYRTDGYQYHLSDLWYSYQSHTRYINRPDIYQACSTKRAIVLAEQDGPPAPGHKLGYEPMGASHSGSAFDISGVTIEALRLAKPDVKAFLATATTGSPACNLDWGGDFRRSLPDKFHFYTPPTN